VKAKVRENDILSVLLAMFGPPPFPTKLFVLTSGAVGMDWRRFLLAVFLGRSIRFLGEAYLAVRLGDQAIDRLKEHYPAIGLTLVVAAVLVLAVRHVARRRATA
jgi:membrane protein DedA with SNARE-associated domain